MGVFLRFPCVSSDRTSLPHACGGVSRWRSSCERREMSSPRMWGCFLWQNDGKLFRLVFPTHVGVFPKAGCSCPARWSLPHACGGVSIPTWGILRVRTSSPRMWGCFRDRRGDGAGEKVFPTHVGVFLPPRRGLAPSGGLPHACGGVSTTALLSAGLRGSSPRMWGCFSFRCIRTGPVFVFPTHVGVFPRPTPPWEKRFWSSPRMWGCFRSCATASGAASVFPTHVGVFLRLLSKAFMPSGLPHACGGVSFARLSHCQQEPSSPRMWGCFWDHFRARIRRRVFPTHVGVFPIPHRNDERRTRLPHACGGVSYTHLSASESSMVFPTHVGVFLA